MKIVSIPKAQEKIVSILSDRDNMEDIEMIANKKALLKEWVESLNSGLSKLKI